jgi:MOSC domain-containing protein YiiM
MLERVPTPPAPPATRTGRLAAVCAAERLERGIGKRSLASARITRHGVPGDVHFGPTCWNDAHDARVENYRPITVLAAEAVRAACEAVGLSPLPAGALGENVLVEGIGDLSDLAKGDLLSVGDALLEVTEQNAPCKNVCVHHPDLLRALVGRRGVICLVRREGEVRPGDAVTWTRA